MTCLLISYQEDDEYSPDYGTIMVSHGVNVLTDELVILPNQPLDWYRYSESAKAYWDESYGGWMID